MGGRRRMPGLCLFCLFCILVAALTSLFCTFSKKPSRPMDKSVYVKLRSRLNQRRDAPLRPGTIPDLEPFTYSRSSSHPVSGFLPTQKQMQAGYVSQPETKGRRRSGPVLGCEQFSSENYTWPADLKTVAIVGNGPLTPASRAEINDMDLVIRFNKLQSYQCGDKFDIWASRHGDAVTTRYWGIGQRLNISSCPFDKLLNLSKHIWLLNGGDGPFNYFLQAYPSIRERANYLWIDCRQWVKRYLRLYDKKWRMGYKPSSQDEVSPSSGWLVITMLRDCAPKGTKLHIYGFNWPGGQWPAHKVENEKEEILLLAKQGKVIIHQTLCKHKYQCDDLY